VLEQFGYNNMKVDGVEATGHRPLLIILVDVAQSLKHTVDGSSRVPYMHDGKYYDALVYGNGDSRFQTIEGHKSPSVADYFLDISNGRFTWSRAAPVIGPLQLSAEDSSLELPVRLAKILTAAVQQAGVNFNEFETSGDKTISSQELGVVIIDNYIPSSDGGATRTSHPNTVSIDVPNNTQSLRIKAAFIGHRAGFMTICHELCHVVGTNHDLYGASGLNQNCTLMDATMTGILDDPQSYHLDSWHKMQFGWSEPRIRTLDSVGTEILRAVNMGEVDAPVILYDPQHGTNEYFILEYRSALNPAGSIYDKNVASNGLAIWHVFTPENKSPVEIPSLTVPDGTDKSVFLDGAPDLTRGGNTLWTSDQVTPPLRWLDGSVIGTRIKVRPFNPTDASITVEIMLNVMEEFQGARDPVTHISSNVNIMGKFSGPRDHTP
jgi:M6 family metalloprotease-like protein